MSEKRFVDHDTSVEDYMESLENSNMKEKTKRDVKLLETFLRNEKNNEQEVHILYIILILYVPCGTKFLQILIFVIFPAIHKNKTFPQKISPE